MRVTVIVTREGRVAGATVAPARAESRVGYPSAWLVAGPGQRLVEVEVSQDTVPGPESEPARIERFLAELRRRIGHDGSHEQQSS